MERHAPDTHRYFADAGRRVPDISADCRGVFSIDRRAPEDLPLVLRIGDLVIEASRMLVAGRTRDVVPLFGLLARWITEGDRDVLNPAVTGFLEDLQSTNQRRSACSGQKRELFWNHRD
ncbi:hypothetical protein [Pararhodobacter sp.]|uniref:hypothetical protein n=1 Tax=Pararhodobacter sp. TaxID=2127056 RepID=UPI002AFF4DEE|nr:hypothetical protein [Pararhodobacter sp.]